jgi:hypothetical protein
MLTFVTTTVPLSPKRLVKSSFGGTTTTRMGADVEITPVLSTARAHSLYVPTGTLLQTRLKGALATLPTTPVV